MSDIDRYTNKVPFFLAGEGAFLRFRTVDLIVLERKYGERFYSHIEKTLNEFSVDTMVECLKVGLKQEDGRQPYPTVDFDDLPFAVQQATQPIFDALSVAIIGQSYSAIIDARNRAMEAARADPTDPLMAEASSLASSGPETRPESLDTKSSI